MKNWNFGCAKTPGLIDRKRPNIRNMGSFTIDQSREFSRQPKFNSSYCLGIILLATLLPSQLEGLPLGNPCEASLMRWGIYQRRDVPQYEEKQMTPQTKSPATSKSSPGKSVQATQPCHVGSQDQVTECSSSQRICEKSELVAESPKKPSHEILIKPSNTVPQENKQPELENKKSNTQVNAQIRDEKTEEISPQPSKKTEKTQIPYFFHVWSFRIGYYGDFVSNRHMEIDRDVDASHLHQVKLTTHAAYLALNFWNLFDLFTTLGASYISLYTPGKVFQPTGLLNNQFVRVESNTNFAWSAGIRGTLWQCGPFGFGAALQYAHARPHLNYFAVEGFDPVYFSSVHLNYHEWQIGVAAAYRFCIGYGMGCSPYLGIRWSHAEVHTTTPLIVVTPETRYTLFDLETSRDIGFSVGMTLIGCSKASFTLEGRFIDETAVYFNSQLRF